MGFIEIAMAIVGFILGGGAGGVIAWLVKSLKVKADMAILQKDLVVSQTKVVELTKQNAELQQKFIDSQALLANTLAALELVKAYQAIDTQTKKDVDDLKATLKDGKASDDTMKKYREMIGKMNGQFADYNKGQKTPATTTTPPATPATPAKTSSAGKKKAK